MRVVSLSRWMISWVSADHLVGALRIERGGVFVQQQQFRLEPGGHEQRQRLALAAGEGADGVVEPVLEAHVEGAHAVAQFAARSRG